MSQMGKIHIEVIELENEVAFLRDSINALENDIKKSAKEHSYSDFEILGTMYRDLSEKKERLNYLRRFV